MINDRFLISSHSPDIDALSYAHQLRKELRDDSEHVLWVQVLISKLYVIKRLFSNIDIFLKVIIKSSFLELCFWQFLISSLP